MTEARETREFRRREFLRGAAIAGGMAMATPVIITLDASPAFATPAPVPVQPVGPDDKKLDDQDVVESPPSPFAALTAKDAAGNLVCANGADLRLGNIGFGHRHIISDGYTTRNGVRVKFRGPHPWEDADISATRDCMNNSIPKVTKKRVVYECCREDSINGKCCRVVVINRKTCNIITSYDTCDGALFPTPIPA